MFKETKVYLSILYLFFIVELVLAIPTVLDSIIYRSGSSMIFIYYAFVHVCLMLWLSTKQVFFASYTPHTLALITFLTNYIPIINFIPHIILCVVVYNSIKTLHKKLRSGEVPKSTAFKKALKIEERKLAEKEKALKMSKLEKEYTDMLQSEEED